ncbi:hypothetical protein UMZ34_17440 [Halopseudomonas pachastrellae]|nr:hypothetical protein UMZ34_17440 [Halopseudomonas pachastrellae]
MPGSLPGCVNLSTGFYLRDLPCTRYHLPHCLPINATTGYTAPPTGCFVC